jgi:hypothetical protein
MSKESAREADPLITDPELEKDRITAESMEAALLSSIQAQAADPSGPYQPDDLAYLTKLTVEENVPLYEAVRRTNERAQERQATAVSAGSPEAQPGLAVPGMGAEAPQARWTSRNRRTTRIAWRSASRSISTTRDTRWCT